jgi:hypothetical protein
MDLQTVHYILYNKFLMSYHPVSQDAPSHPIPMVVDRNDAHADYAWFLGSINRARGRCILYLLELEFAFVGF